MLTKNQVARFAQLDAYYKTKVPLENDSVNLRTACEMVRESAISRSSTPIVNLADELIMPSSTLIAYVRGAVEVLRPKVTSGAFCKIVEKMREESLSTEKISRRHFLDLRQEFYDAAQYRSEQCFNRFTFACFPLQFCSVVSPRRLRAVLNELNRHGLLTPNWTGCSFPKMKSLAPDVGWHENILASQPKKHNDDEWYNLCETVMPVIKEAFPLRDYAEHSCFLARIGKRLNELGVSV